MPVLTDQVRAQVSKVFSERLDAPVTLQLFTQRASPLGAPALPCETCQDTEALLREVAALSAHITLAVRDFVADESVALRLGVDRIPAMVFQGRNKGVMRYFGVPAGYEFSVLVEGLIDAARGETALSAATRERVAALASPIQIRVLVTPT
ncbi:MAG TPA: hypothetical protein VKZ50_10000 [bacterium]|nr:hypothetical protein [bacterium]